MASPITEYPHFFTATNLEWKKLLAQDKYKDVIIESMRFLVKDKRVIIYGFVIMDNHIYITWQLQAGRKRRYPKRFFEIYCTTNKERDVGKSSCAYQRFFCECKRSQVSILGKKPTFHRNMVRESIFRKAEIYS